MLCACVCVCDVFQVFVYCDCELVCGVVRVLCFCSRLCIFCVFKDVRVRFVCDALCALLYDVCVCFSCGCVYV